jgi:hemoglobin-like flavoprotein
MGDGDVDELLGRRGAEETFLTCYDSGVSCCLSPPCTLTDNWEDLRRVKNFEEVAGCLLFQKLFVKEPKAKILFGFPIDIDPMSEDVKKSRRFIMHASYLIQMIDTALNMLGPDSDLLTEIMFELGEKHVRYGVKAIYFPIMGDCLIETLEETLGKMQPATKTAWIETYANLSGDMIKAQPKEALPEKQPRKSSGRHQ